LRRNIVEFLAKSGGIADLLVRTIPIHTWLQAPTTVHSETDIIIR